MRYNKAIILFTSLFFLLVFSGFSLLFLSTSRIKEYVDKYTIYEQVQAKVVNYVAKDKKKAIIVEYKVNQKSYKLESKVFKKKNIEIGENITIAYNIDDPNDAIWMPLNENNMINYLFVVISFIFIVVSIIVGLFDYKLIKNNMVTEYVKSSNGFYYDKILYDEIGEEAVAVRYEDVYGKEDFTSITLVNEESEVGEVSDIAMISSEIEDNIKEEVEVKETEEVVIKEELPKAEETFIVPVETVLEEKKEETEEKVRPVIEEEEVKLVLGEVKEEKKEVKPVIEEVEETIIIPIVEEKKIVKAKEQVTPKVVELKEEVVRPIIEEEEEEIVIINEVQDEQSKNALKAVGAKKIVNANKSVNVAKLVNVPKSVESRKRDSVVTTGQDKEKVKGSLKQQRPVQQNRNQVNKTSDSLKKNSNKVMGILIMVLLIPFIVKAEDTDNYYIYDYVIDKLDVEIKVNENNTYDIVETIDVDYNYQKRSIYRRIPLYNTFPRLDGLDIKKRVQISDLEVNAKYSKTIVNQDIVIKIGDNKNSLDSSHYVFKYKYNKGPDEIKGKDEFLFNIVGKDWDTVIKNVTFKIIMPEKIDEKKVTILQGTTDILSKDNVEYQVKDNVITGRVKVMNKPAEYVYARIDLKDGYFKNAKYKVDYKVIFMFIVPTILLVVSYLLWYKYGKDDKLTLDKKILLNSYNSLEVEYLYYGNASLKGVSLLLFDLANKGKIRIRRVKKEESLINQEEHIIEIIDTNDLNIVEKVFIKGLLACKKEHTLNHIKDNEIVISELANGFYNTLYKIQDSINNKKNHSWLFLNRKKELLINFIIMIVSLMVIVVIPVLSFSSILSASLVVLLILLYLPFIAGLISKSRIELLVRIFLLVFLIIHLFIMFSLTPLYDAIMYDKAYLVGFIYGIVAEIAMFIFCVYMSKRTDEGILKLSEITSFRNNLKNMSKMEFNTLMSNNKNYYYMVLQHINSLNIYEYVREKLNMEMLDCPEWLVNGEDIPKGEIDTYIHNLMEQTYEIMSSVK